MSLTPKQEKFAQKYVELGNASEAYRQAYDVKKMSAAAVSVEASNLLANPKVALRVSELQQAAVKRHEITVDDIISELEEARQVALTGRNPNPSSMVSATMGKAKVLGLVSDKVEHTGSVALAVNISSEQAKRIAKEVLLGDAG